MSTNVDFRSLLKEINPYEFEYLVSDLWKVYGWKTSVTSRSHDGGIDVRAHRPGSNEELVLIQSKAYNPDNKIQSDEVRNYAKLYQQEPDADKVVLVTTSSFTDPAIDVAAEYDVYCVDCDDLRTLIGGSTLRFVDLTTLASRSSQKNPDWLWKPLKSTKETKQIDPLGIVREVQGIISQLQTKRGVRMVEGPAFLHPELPFEDQTCANCVTSIIYGIKIYQLNGWKSLGKICAECLRLFLSRENSWMLVNHFHPFNSDVISECRPKRSQNMIDCPVCPSRRTLWTAEGQNNRYLMLCTNCNTVWESRPVSNKQRKWRCIERRQSKIRVGTIQKESAFTDSASEKTKN